MLPVSKTPEALSRIVEAPYRKAASALQNILADADVAGGLCKPR